MNGASLSGSVTRRSSPVPYWTASIACADHDHIWTAIAEKRYFDSVSSRMAHRDLRGIGQRIRRGLLTRSGCQPHAGEPAVMPRKIGCRWSPRLERAAGWRSGPVTW
jgi:hypothetical protein